MRAKILAGELLSQCPTCLALRVQVDPKRVGVQQSICRLPNVPVKTCEGCKNK